MWHKYIVSKYPKSLDEEVGTKFKGSLPNLVHEGHTVVVEGFIKPLKDDSLKWHYEYYCSVTEVLSQPDLIVAAMDRNTNIIADKQNVALEEPEAAINGYFLHCMLTLVILASCLF